MSCGAAAAAAAAAASAGEAAVGSKGSVASAEFIVEVKGKPGRDDRVSSK